jgi:hypothetical protein
VNTTIAVVKCDMNELPNIVPGTVIERVTLFKRQNCYSKYRCRYIDFSLVTRSTPGQKDHEAVFVKFLCLRVLMVEEKNKYDNLW